MYYTIMCIILKCQCNRIKASTNQLSLGSFADSTRGERKEIPHEIECVVNYLTPNDNNRPNSNRVIPQQETRLPSSSSTSTLADDSSGMCSLFLLFYWYLKFSSI